MISSSGSRSAHPHSAKAPHAPSVSRNDSVGGGLAQVHRAECFHLARLVALVVGTVVAELAILVPAPALDATRDENCAGMKESSGNAGGGLAELHGSQTCHLARLVAFVVGAVIAELAKLIRTPAFDSTRDEEGATMHIASRDGGGLLTKIYSAQVRHVTGCAALAVGVIVSKLSCPVHSPALDSTRGEQGASVHGTSRDGGGGLAELHGSQARHLARLITFVVGAVIAELAKLIRTPALDSTRGD
jgi:cytochrome b